MPDIPQGYLIIVMVALIGFFFKRLVDKLEAGNETMNQINLNVAKIIVKIENQNDRINKLELDKDDHSKRIIELEKRDIRWKKTT